MKHKFRNKYRSQTTRLRTWNYAWNAAYFVTICTKNRAHFFGKIVNGHMQLTDIGQMAEKCWMEIPQHFPFVELGAFVVMPNHVHGIIVINVGPQNIAVPVVEPQNIAALPPQNIVARPQPQNQFGPQSKNLASIVRGFKIGVTKFARQNNLTFAWQSLYHDHIIRNNESFNRIQTYIIENPSKWKDDGFCKG